MQTITQARLKEILHYAPGTGIFTWRERTSPRIQIGDIAGCLDKTGGYRIIRIKGRTQLAHRLAFLYMTGAFPPDQTDHINHVRDDNRWSNLRLATNQENGRNQKRHATNKTGVAGVRWREGQQRWVSEIMRDRGARSLGTFTTIIDAVCARKRAEKEHGYHENHGKPLPEPPKT